MPIGYANFSTIEQANNQTVKQLAGLGQQIGNAIETHAATQSAQAMLPMLQQQYQTGMAKIADGKPEGLSDIYSASIVASQNPLLAPMAKNAITTAQSANINAQHMARTQAYLEGRQASLYGQYGSGLMPAPEGMNPNWQGKQTQQRGFTPYQQTQAQVNQAKSYSSIYQGKPDTAKGPGEPGIGPLADKINTALNNNKIPDPEDVRNFASKYAQYRQLQSAYGQNAIAHPEIENAFNQLQGQIPKLNKLVSEEQAKPEFSWTDYKTWGNKKDASTISTANQELKQLQQLKSLGGIPAARGGNGPVIPPEAIQILQKDPSKQNQDYFDTVFGKGAAQQLIQRQPSAQETPETQDESEAVGGGNEQE